MNEYLTTREVAAHLRINEKKVYDLVAHGQLPAARVSGKWLFPRRLVDQWVERNTVLPEVGLMGALLDEMVVLQGSDDWLLGQVAEQCRDRTGTPVVSARVGSLAGLQALSTAQAHAAGCHVDTGTVRQLAGSGQGCYLVTLFGRRQGLLFDRERHSEINGLASLTDPSLRFADRQPLSGTSRLTRRLCAEAGVTLDGRTIVGPFTSHLELALAIRRGEADLGLGTQLAAEQCGLSFLELHLEAFRLAVPLAFAGHPRMAGFLVFALETIKATAAAGVSGYEFADSGHLDTVAPDPGPPSPVHPNRLRR